MLLWPFLRPHFPCYDPARQTAESDIAPTGQVAGYYFHTLAHPCTHLLLGHGLVFDRSGSCWRRGRRCHGDGGNVECCAQHVLPLPPARCPPDTAHTATELKTLRGGPVHSGLAIKSNQGLKPSGAVECCSCEGTNIPKDTTSEFPSLSVPRRCSRTYNDSE